MHIGAFSLLALAVHARPSPSRPVQSLCRGLAQCSQDRDVRTTAGLCSAPRLLFFFCPLLVFLKAFVLRFFSPSVSASSKCFKVCWRYVTYKKIYPLLHVILSFHEYSYKQPTQSNIIRVLWPFFFIIIFYFRHFLFWGFLAFCSF